MAAWSSSTACSRAPSGFTSRPNRFAARVGPPVRPVSANGERQAWDARRFLQTVTFFNSPLQIASRVARVVTAPLRTSTSQPAQDEELPYETFVGKLQDPQTPAVLVTGATGGVGSRVIAQLLARGARVRALVRDMPKAREMLGSLPAASSGVLEVAAGDLTQPATLQKAMFSNVRSVVSCAGCVVRAKEAEDEADRTAKYMQGIKFFDPEVVRDTPDAVERDGLSTILDLIAPQLGLRSGEPLLCPSAGLMPFEEQWGPLDDVVMGGASQSGLYRVAGGGPEGDDTAVFRGVVSVANNGGFSSVRPRNWDPPLDLTAYEGVRVTLRGDGQRYKFILRCSNAWDSVAYCRSVDTPTGEWVTLDLPFSEFKPVFRARTDPSAPPLDPSAVHSIQIMLSKFEYDGALNPSFSPGAFELPISSISAYLSPNAAPRFVHVSSAGVTRINRPGIDVEQEPPAVRMNDMLGGLLTYKLAGEDLLRSSGVPFAIVRPCALTLEPSGMPVELDQGDTLKGKIGRDDVASLCLSLLDSNAAVDTTFEVRSTVPFAEPWTEEDSAAAQARDWASTLEAADLRKGVTGKTVNGVYTGKEVETEAVDVKQPQVAQR